MDDKAPKVGRRTFTISDVTNGRVRALKLSTVFHQQAPTWLKA